MAIFTIVNEQEIDTLLLQYSLGNRVGFNGIKEGIQNTNYMLKTDKGSFILTIYETFYNKPQDLPFFTQLMLHLEKKNIPCPKPIPTKNDKLFITFKQKPTAIFSFIEGMQANQLSIDHKVCYQTGKILAQMHLATQDFNIRRKNQIGIYEIYQKFIKWENQFDEIQRPIITKEIKRILENIIKNYPKDDTDIPKSVIHADLFTDNVFFKGNQISGIIDLNFSCNDFMLYDLAIAINAWCFKDNGNIFEKEFALAMLKGYESVRKITLNEKNHFNLIYQAAAMRYLVSRLYDQSNTPENAIVDKKEPLEYLNILRFHLANQKKTEPTNSVPPPNQKKPANNSIKEKNIAEIYIDGSCLVNPGFGAWSVIITDNKKNIKKFSQAENDTTNNRMEITAAINALKQMHNNSENYQKFNIYTDSKHVFDGVKSWLNKWKANQWKNSKNKQIANIELWKKMDQLLEKNKTIECNWFWVKAHAGNEFNEMADKLARQTAVTRKAKTNSN